MFRTLLTPIAAIAVAMLAVAPAAAGTETATLEIQHRLCPTEYAEQEFEADCTEVSETSIMFDLMGPTAVQGEIDAEGNAVFTDLDPGDYTIVGGVPGEFADNVITCAADGQDVSHEAGPASLDVTLPAGATVTCQWYDIPLDLRGDTPPDTALPADGAVVPHDMLIVAGLLVTSAGIRLAAVTRRARH